jgi:uncharacterized protein (TIGR03066 family)
MRTVWTVMVGCMVLGLPLVGSADAGKKAIDKTKLVGVWEPTKPNDLTAGSTLEFTADGKLHTVAKLGDKTAKGEGTYKVEGDKLHMVLKIFGKDAPQTLTVKTLTDTTLVTVDEKGAQDEFKRKKK